MAKKKQLTAEEVKKINSEKARKAGLASVDESTSVNFSSDSSLVNNDSLVRKKGFRLLLARNLISLKNHISKVPMFFCVCSMIVICVCEFVHIRALPLLTSVAGNGSMNAVYFFITLLLAVLSVVVYMNATNKHSSKKKKIVMLVIFFIMMIGQLGLNINYIININYQWNVSFTASSTNEDIINSYTYTILHSVFLVITIICAGLEPVLQPIFKQIHIK